MASLSNSLHLVSQANFEKLLFPDDDSHWLSQPFENCFSLRCLLLYKLFALQRNLLLIMFQNVALQIYKKNESRQRYFLGDLRYFKTRYSTKQLLLMKVTQDFRINIYLLPFCPAVAYISFPLNLFRNLSPLLSPCSYYIPFSSYYLRAIVGNFCQRIICLFLNRQFPKQSFS